MVLTMAISGIGYSQTYYYNAATKKFSSKNHEGQTVADSLNAENGNQQEELKDYEEREKCLIEAFLRLQNGSANTWDKFQTVEGEKNLYEITYVKENELESAICVGGQEVFRQMASFCLPGTISGKWDNVFPDKVPYNKENNSAVIVPGDRFVLKNGYELEVGKNGVYVTTDSYEKGSAEDTAYAEKMADAFTEFLKTANRGCFDLAVSSMDSEITQDVMDVIGQTGINLGREFSVNGTRFSEQKGKLFIVGAFAEGSKVWDREAAWRREAMNTLLREELGVTDEQLEKGLKDYGSAMPEKGVGAPYSYLANKDGVVEYNGVVFTLDNEREWLCLGDMSNLDNVIRIPLSEGGCLMVNRANIDQLAHAIGMFSPEDINLILRALKLDAKIQQMQKEIEEMEEGIGKDNKEEYADTAKEAKEAAKENGNADGFNGYGKDAQKGMFELEEWQLELLLDEKAGLLQLFTDRNRGQGKDSGFS